MKALRITSIPALVLVLAMVLNSCGTTNFKGYYPDNRISGKGAGQTESAATNVATVKTSTKMETLTEDVAEAMAVANEAVAEEAVAIAPKKKFTGEKMEKFAFNAFAKSRWGQSMLNEEATAEERIAMIAGKGLNGLVMRKVAERAITKRYGTSAGMPLEDIFAIISLSAGGAAWLWYAGFFFGPAAIAFGIVALIKGTSRRGMAIAGICLGAVALFFWILFIAVIWGGRGLRRGLYL